MLVRITNLMGFGEDVWVKRTTTVEEMLDYLERALLRSGGPDQRTILLQERFFLSRSPRNNLELVDGFMLTDYGVKDGSTIFVFLKLNAAGECRVTGMLL